MYTTLISAPTLHAHHTNPAWVVVDCRFSLADTAAGQRAYETAHIPRAIYAHLDHDLSGPPVTDAGRHPLPSPDSLRELFGRMGIQATTQVVAYDDAGGMVASRLWWMLRYMGHTAVAVLDGGWQTWTAEGYPTRAGTEQNQPALFTGQPQTDKLVVLADVAQQPLLIDSRDADRYRGENETIDAQAGHIPHAINYPFKRNLGSDGRYLPPAQLHSQLAAVLGQTPPDQATFYCGSGVSACVNLLALAHAGLGDGRLYVGSWSEWSKDDSRPIATGDF
jgi:thiosulfate/3-mercaptopyruvate sulfurtransferase